MAVDISKFGVGEAASSPVEINKFWWKLPKSDIPAAITGVIRFLQQHQGARQTQLLVSARLYGNLSIMGLNGLSYSRVTSVQNQLKDRISFNVCQAVVDTITSKIAKNRPKPMFLTSGGDYKIQRRAKKLDQFCEGIFYDNKAYEMGPQVFRDGCVSGTGIVHVFEEYGRVKWERVMAGELFVDEVEGFYGFPRQIHRVKNVDRQVLIDAFPEHRKAIMRANKANTDALGGYENISDVVTVRESWHLPSGPDAKDGIKVITVEGEVLDTATWDKPYFPFAMFHWSKRLYGFWGQGLVEQVQNIQLEINKLLWVIQRSMHLAGTFKVLLENGSKIVKEHLNNDIGAIINYTGTQPTYVTPPIVPQEIYMHLQTLKNSAYEQAGISQLSAAAKKPDGLDSGKALREFNDIETDRFMTVGQAYEQFFLQLSRLSIDVAKGIYDREGAYEVNVPGSKFLKTIDWSEVDLEDDEYVMKAYPVSSLPNTPAGRLQTIQEYIQAGFLTPRAGRRLLDFPDLEQVETLANAQENYLHEVFEKMLDDEPVFTAPEPQDDLRLARTMALEYYAQGKCNGVEEEKLELIRRFISQIDVLEQRAMAESQAMAPAAPQAMPEPAPVSDLIPNVPTAA
jgi:hypothetical protein